MLHYYYNILCIPFVGDNIFDYPDLSWICFCRHWIYTSYDGLCSILGLIYTYMIRVNKECKPTVVVLWMNLMATKMILKSYILRGIYNKMMQHYDLFFVLYIRCQGSKLKIRYDIFSTELEIKFHFLLIFFPLSLFLSFSLSLFLSLSLLHCK